jgi:hypothetical protein
MSSLPCKFHSLQNSICGPLPPSWQVADMRKDISTVVAACDELLGSEHLHGWLQVRPRGS